MNRINNFFFATFIYTFNHFMTIHLDKTKQRRNNRKKNHRKKSYNLITIRTSAFLKHSLCEFTLLVSLFKNVGMRTNERALAAYTINRLKLLPKFIVAIHTYHLELVFCPKRSLISCWWCCTMAPFLLDLSWQCCYISHFHSISKSLHHEIVVSALVMWSLDSLPTLTMTLHQLAPHRQALCAAEPFYNIYMPFLYQFMLKSNYFFYSVCLFSIMRSVDWKKKRETKIVIIENMNTWKLFYT